MRFTPLVLCLCPTVGQPSEAEMRMIKGSYEIAPLSALWHGQAGAPVAPGAERESYCLLTTYWSESTISS